MTKRIPRKQASQPWGSPLQMSLTPRQHSETHRVHLYPDGSKCEITGVIVWCHDCGRDMALMPGHPSDPDHPTQVVCRPCLYERARNDRTEGASNAGDKRT